jgi:DNA repair protein RAD57
VQGGPFGSACYITINSALHTKRLLQLITNHPLLSSETCSLDNIQTIATPTIPILISILSKVLPDLIAQRARSPGLKPVRLLVIDALADLFFVSDKASTGTLIERSQNIVEISSLLHSLDSAHDMIILVLNNTTDIFQVGDRAEAGSGEELHYKQQSRCKRAYNDVPHRTKALPRPWPKQTPESQ